MEQKPRDKEKKRSFSFYLLISMIVIVLCIVGFLTINDYLYTKDNFDRESHLLQIRENGMYGSGVRFEIEVPEDRFRFVP